jgi:hypothetical protein
MPKPSKHTASRRANLAAAEAVIEQIPDQEILERTLLESQTKLYNAQQQIASLESVLSDKVAACSELSLSLGETEMKAEEYLSQISEQKAQYQSLYKELRSERQRSKQAITKKGLLEHRIALLKAAALSHSHELKSASDNAYKANSVLQLEKQNSSGKNKLSLCAQNLQEQMQACQNRLNAVQKQLSDSRSLSFKLKKCVDRAKDVHDCAVLKAHQKQQRLSSVHHLLHKGVYTEKNTKSCAFSG